MEDLGIPIYSGVVTPGAYATTANLLAGTSWQFLQKGYLTICAKGSAAGINIICKLNGSPVVDDKSVIMTGTTGGLVPRDNVLSQVLVNGGTAELYAKNITATAGTTCDIVAFWKPSK